MKVLLTAINSKYIHTGLGIRYVGEYAKQQGFAVQFLEETINTQILDVLEKIMTANADVYGFSVHIWNKTYVFKLITMLRQLKRNVKIIVGGPEVSFDVERIFYEQPAIDYIVQGEGELCFSELLRYLEQGELFDVPVPRHIAYVDILEGKVETNGGVTGVQDLSLLPFPYPDLQGVLEEHKIVYYEATRGCPFSCAYCMSSIGKTVRKRPLELVLRDMDRFIEAGATLVKFVDRTYNLDVNYFLPMMKHLAAADTRATFHFEIKADILTKEVLDFLETVPKGRFQLEIGIQSTHQPTLKAINRIDNWINLKGNVERILTFHNMHVHVDLIAGLPFEDLETFGKSFDDVYALHADMLQLGFLKVLPGTQMRKEEQEHGLIYMQEPPYEILATKYVPYEDMQLLKRIENVLDQTGNSGSFNHILEALMRLQNLKPFAFYRHLTDWWVKAGHYPQTHNAKGVAQILWQYIEEHFETAKVNSLREVLRYDVFTHVPGWRPEWLGWQTEEIFEIVSDFWRNEEKVQQILPGYTFSSWRQIHKNTPIERFSIHWETMEQGEYFVMQDVASGKATVVTLC